MNKIINSFIFFLFCLTFFLFWKELRNYFENVVLLHAVVVVATFSLRDMNYLTMKSKVAELQEKNNKHFKNDE